MSDQGGIGTDGVGFGQMIEAGAKMGQQVREGEARLRGSRGPDHRPPRRDGLFRRIIRRIRGRAS